MSRVNDSLAAEFYSALSDLMENWKAPEPGEKVSILDCLYSYRMLLGRNPGVESELPHLAKVAGTLTHREYMSSVMASEEFRQQVGLISPGRFLMAELPDFKFWFNTSDCEMGVRMGFGVYEEETIDYFRSVIKPGMVCWDIGAQTGFFTCLFSRLVGASGAVVAYEPMPSSFDLVVKNINENGFDGRARVFNSACSSEAGEVPMIVASQMFVVDKKAKEAKRIRCVRLDEESHSRLPDLIKIDVEGHEPAVLDGLKGVLDRCSPTLVLELNEYWLSRCSGKTSGEVIRSLNDIGYVVSRMDDIGTPIEWRDFKQGVLGNCNVIAKKSGKVFGD